LPEMREELKRLQEQVAELRKKLTTDHTDM